MAHCQKITDLSDGFGLSIPAMMIKFVGTKADILNGNGTGNPVSGCSEESTTVEMSKSEFISKTNKGNLDERCLADQIPAASSLPHAALPAPIPAL